MNLRGGLWNKRGEAAQAEGGNVFGQGSMTTIAVTLLVRSSDLNKAEGVNYFDIGDHLTTEEKLLKLSLLNNLSNVDWEVVVPNEQSDWINQRSEVYEDFIPLLDKNNRGSNGQSIFVDGTQGLVSAKDSWAYNFSREALENNVSRMISAYQEIAKQYSEKAISMADLKNLPKSRISWDEGLFKRCIANKPLEFQSSDIQLCQYRPFARRWGYRNNDFIWSQYRTRFIFPNEVEVPAIAVTGASPSTFSALAIKNLPDFNFLLGMSYPLYLYDTEERKDEFALDFNNESKIRRRDGVTDFALKLFEATYNSLVISKEDIFNYTYAVLNSKDYKKYFAQDARKSGPAIPLLKNFESYAIIGKKLLDLHLNYDSFADFSGELGVEIEIMGKDAKKDVHYRVEKMRIIKDKNGKKDFSRIIFNEYITIRNIPETSYNFAINGRSAIEWVIDQYQVNQDKSTGNVSDPNELSQDQQFTLNTLLSVIYVGHETSKLLNKYPDFEIIE
jgi:predicted helicase